MTDLCINNKTFFASIILNTVASDALKCKDDFLENGSFRQFTAT